MRATSKCPNPARGFYERPAEFVRAGGHVVDARARRVLYLCEAHRRPGDELVERIPRDEGRGCGFGFNAPPPGGVFIETQARGARRKRGRR